MVSFPKFKCGDAVLYKGEIFVIVDILNWFNAYRVIKRDDIPSNGFNYINVVESALEPFPQINTKLGSLL